MDARRLVKVSKWLALHLRHRPERVGLTLDGAGWADVDELLARAAASNFALTREELVEVVATNDKRRYELDAAGGRIRAVQGHTVAVDLGLVPVPPPALLYHGTTERYVTPILAEGLHPMGRHHVHLSPDVATARTVGRRRGPPVVLEVAAERMASEGRLFFRSANGVWLCDEVPARFLRRL
ncbi:MAG TPA: RNA 2'-phosphotransferase [Acidimicrobiales bacterium]|nr:RNA 2'-phosphotransferase [Acidimicrobiales bacterium]